MSSITFIVLVGNKDVYRRCFLSSPLFQSGRGMADFQVLAQTGFKAASLALNDGIEKSDNELIVCVHQDVILPVTWADSFLEKRREVESLGVPVGVVGCWGITSGGERAGHVYHRDRQLYPRKSGDAGNSEPMSLPKKVETLDELLISFRKSSGLRFDPTLPSFFGYAVDLCLQSDAKGLQNFAIDCPCVHQTADQRRIRAELFQSNTYLVEKWRNVLPIHTPSGALDGKWSLWRDRLKLELQALAGYTPSRMWWEELPQVDPDLVLLASTCSTRHKSS